MMRRALELAARGRGRVSPNPMVGAVIVKDGKVVGEGFHTYPERKHAEVWALERAGENARGATCYVTLEPCRHFGRTPPCTRALIAAGLSRVVVAMQDPNPLVGGNGLIELTEAGVEVEVGLMREEAERLNEIFINYIQTQRPFVHLKAATTLDGRIATCTGQSRWITSEESRYRSQLLRAEYDAILVGSGTVLADDPELTLRVDVARHKPLYRVVLDRRLRTPLHARVVSDVAPVLIFASEAAAVAHHGERLADIVSDFKKRGVEVYFISEDGYLRAVLEQLAKQGITSLIVEGGAEINWQFIASGLVDKYTLFLAPIIVGGRAALSSVAGAGFAELASAFRLRIESIERVGQDVCLTAYPAR